MEIPVSPGKTRTYSIDQSYMSKADSIASPGGNNNRDRFAEKDSLYLDMGKPEINGKIGTLTNGSHGDSILLHKVDSHASVTPKEGSTSSFAKGIQQPDQKSRSKSFRGHAGVGNNQSFLKAAIFRNMQKNSDFPGEDSKEEPMDIKHKRRESDRPSLYNRMGSNVGESENQNRKKSSSNSDIDSSSDICSENPQVQMNVEKIKAGTPEMKPSKHAHSPTKQSHLVAFKKK